MLGDTQLTNSGGAQLAQYETGATAGDTTDAGGVEGAADGDGSEVGPRATRVAPARFAGLVEGTKLWGFRTKNPREPQKWVVSEVLVRSERVFCVRFRFLKEFNVFQE